MSETINNQIPLNKIIAPSLDDAGYASGLNNVFTNINDNFATLANRDFVKGESGTSVEIHEDKLINADGTLTVLGQKLKYCINNLSNREDEYADVITKDDEKIGVFDHFNANPGSIYMVYNTVNDVNTQVPVAKSSLYYVFLDGRYATAKIGNIDESQYTNIKDFSCILVYDENEKSVIDNVEISGGFKVLPNAFPTIYYEDNVGLCWKVNGNNTGIPVQGLPGRDGLNSTLYLVKCNTITVENSVIHGEVTGLYGAFDGYRPITSDTNIDYLNNCSALVLAPNPDDESGNLFYFGVLSVKEIQGEPIYNAETEEYTDNIIKKLYAYCNHETAINYGVETETFINSMKNINILSRGEDTSSGIKGLFIPMQTENEYGEQPVHLLSATSITNTIGQSSDLKTDVVFTPVNDINKLVVTGDRDDMGEDEGNLMVDKYLYVKVNKNSGIFNDFNKGLEIGGIDFSKLEKYDYILKYKLSTVIKDAYDAYGNVNPYFNAFTNDNYESGSRAFGRVFASVVKSDDVTMQIEPPKEPVALSDDNVKYYKYGNGPDVFLPETTTNHLESMPTTFRYRLGNGGLGIYRWELCKEYAPYDIDELLNNAEYNTEHGSYEPYNFENKFNVIYTTTVNPNVATEFMWFNGMELVTSSKELNIKDPNDPNAIWEDKANLGGWDYMDQKYIIYGWNNGIGNNPLFEFIKFVPIYDNDFYIKDDTALNINYNVNITGDQTNPNKNITIHGSVNCDNLSVYRLTATGEIQNIYTKEPIVGESGIALGSVTINKDTDDEAVVSAFTVSPEGLLNTKDGLFAKYINCLDNNDNVKEHTVLADTLESRQVDTNELMIDDVNGTRRIFIGNTGTDEKYRLGFEIKDNEGISISRTNDKYWKVDPHNMGNYNTKDNTDVPVITNDVPIIQSANTSLIISNQPASSTQLCYDGALSQLVFNGGIAKPGMGVTTGSDDLNIETIDFDVVKNFNMHRLAQTSADVTTTSVSKSVQSSAQRSIKPYTHTSALVRSLNYNYTPNITAVKNSDYIEKITIAKSPNTLEKMSIDTPITIRFKHAYGCHIGVRGECSNGRWPVMSYSGSNVNLHVVYVIDGSTVGTVGSKTFKISYSTDNFKNDGGKEWTGGKGGNYSNIWRYYRFIFKPTDFTLQTNTSNTSDFRKIVNAYNDGKQITFYIFSSFNLTVVGQQNVLGKSKEIVSGIEISRPVVVPAYDKSTTTQLNLFSTGTFNETETHGVNAQVTYGVNVSLSKNEIKSTTLCNDGIVTRAGDYTFGLGYSKTIVDHSKDGGYNIASTTSKTDPSWTTTDTVNNVPILFYYKNNSDYYLNSGSGGMEPKTGGKDNAGYARRIHAIPLSDIFGAIRTIRLSSLTKYGL